MQESKQLSSTNVSVQGSGCQPDNSPQPKRTLSVAPMLDLTDRHYRYMARLITRNAWLYTEMINANAIIHGNSDKLLIYHPQEQPVALQLGGSDPAALAQAAKIAAGYAYNEINLNCGCPSPRVQQGAFGACLMREVTLVAQCLNAMQEAVSIPVTIKHRIGLDKETAYQPLADFVGTLREQTACRIFIVHARNAWLEGLSPKDNRDIPPLRYDYVYRLKQEFPDLEIILNGGVTTNEQISQHLQYVDGVMVGREAYHNPMLMRSWDAEFYGSRQPAVEYEALVEQLIDYTQQQLAKPNHSLRHMARHYLGLMHGLHGARQWRRMLSDAALLKNNNASLIAAAWQAVKNSSISQSVSI
ncbi:tRNA dihydrouridine(20/20a) synthase DusA [Snodgrassella communis]|uniref:tRNA dihydrouridine(20/20a) synthase DusA n=1 Tax=Snodgrassella communis TaxID=2946699 RepID=UPI0023B31CE5|nr:tRNA dihydrouridine(20/20a) synthase DusA [Snodgrassella communis]